MKWNEIKKLAINNGFIFVTHGGKHDVYYNPKTDKTIVIERHWSQEVRKGLLERLLKTINS